MGRYDVVWRENGKDWQAPRWFVRIDATDSKPELRFAFYMRDIAEHVLAGWVAQGRTGIVFGAWPDTNLPRRPVVPQITPYTEPDWDPPVGKLPK